jgi:hypothetical protein
VAQGTFEGYATTFVVQMFGFEQAGIITETEPAENTNLTVSTEPEISAPTVAGLEAPETEPNIVIAAAPPTQTAISLPLAPNPEAMTNSATLDLSSLILTPIKNGYQVSIHMNHVTEAALNFGSAQTPLEYHKQSDSWLGTILYDPKAINDTGEQLFVVVTGQDGQQQIFELTTLMPSADTSTVYTATTPKLSPKVFGIFNQNNLGSFAVGGHIGENRSPKTSPGSAQPIGDWFSFPASCTLA